MKGWWSALLAAKKAGKFRYVGFTGHKDPYIHNRMLEAAQAHNFHFDTAQMPLKHPGRPVPQLRAGGGPQAGGNKGSPCWG